MSRRDYDNENVAADAAYFPTSANWPVARMHVDAFHATLLENIFCPIHVVDVNGQYVDPVLFASRLPGALVKVYFTLRYWNFKGKNYNSYSANVQQVQILQAAPTIASSIGKRLVARAGARVAVAGMTAGKRGASLEAEGPEKRARVDVEQGGCSARVLFFFFIDTFLPQRRPTVWAPKLLNTTSPA